MTTAKNQGAGAEIVGDRRPGDAVEWTAMEDGTHDDYQWLGALYEDHARLTLVDSLLGVLTGLAGPKLGYQIDRYDHSLQAASRALRADESADMVVGALLHDIGDVLAPHNHSETAAVILAPYVDDETHWIVKHHGLFQGYYYFHHHGGDRNARELYSDAPHYDACVRFCARYDQNCFDPDYENFTVEAFRPALAEVFGRSSKVSGIAPMA